MQRRLDALEGELETGRAILVSAMELLDDPKALYEGAKTPARKVLNKAIFTKLYIDDLGSGPTITHDELTEPFATVVYARRAEAGQELSSIRQAALETVQTAEGGKDASTDSDEQDLLSWLEAELQDVWARAEEGNWGSVRGLSTRQEGQRGDLLKEITPGLTNAALLTCSWNGGCSSAVAMVPTVGFEPTLTGS